MRALKILSILFLLGSSLYGQRNCGSHELLLEKARLHPALDLIKAVEVKSRGRSTVTGIITIPVVVHVVYNTPAENISDEQIMSQIEVLNEDFRRRNADSDNTWSQAADTEIEFCLASRDIYGDATCGITRTYTDSTKFRVKKNMKFEATGGKSGWPEDEYLNIWVCDISGLLGFATFPNDPDRDEDGVVVDYLSFGRIGDLKLDFALGRTTTHEVGHWLNLRHIWGDGDCSFDDFVSDTPASDDHNYACDVGHVSCGSVDMVQNYMDYSDDVCMNLFTEGQKARMRAQFEQGAYKESFLTSKGCDAPLECNQLSIEIKFDTFPGDISWVLKNESGLALASGSGYDKSMLDQTVRVYADCLADGTYSFEISDSFGDGLCCNEGQGGYLIYGTYGDLVLSSGNFGYGEVRSFDLVNKYRFIGPGIDWQNPSNWNKLDPPSDCYDGEIIIEKDCEVEGLNLRPKRQITVRAGAQLIVK